MMKLRHVVDQQKIREEGEIKDIRIILERELKQLQSLMGLNNSLKVKWIPNRSREVHGEVKGDTIYVYDEGVEEAVRTLKHEFVGYSITREVVTLLVDLVNALIKSRETEVYRRKEKLVELFSNLI